MNNIQQYIIKINKSRGKLESLESRKKVLSNNQSKLVIRQKALEEAQAFIQQIARDTQEQLKFNIVDTVNLCIATCFSNITFDIDFKIQNNRTVARLIYKKGDYEIDPLDGSGGGIVDLTSLALRMALWNISKTENVIILDEPLKWLQPKELQMEAFKTIKMLSEKLSLQFIIIANSVGSDNIIDISDRVFDVSLTKQKINDVMWDEVSKVIARSN
jgi:hypothetical protein